MGTRSLVFSTNLLLNTNNTKEMVMDLRVDPVPLQIEGICVERVSSFRFLEAVVVSKVQQRLQFLRLLNKCHLGGQSATDVLPLHSRKHAWLWHFSVVRWLHGQGQESPAEGDKDKAEG